MLPLRRPPQSRRTVLWSLRPRVGSVSRMRWPGLLIVLIALAAGCGGNGDDSGPLSRADYTKQANASCVEAERKLDALGGFENFKELEREMKAGQEAMQQSAQELRELQPPKPLATRHAELVDLTEQTAELAGRLAIVAGKNDQTEMQRQAERAEKLTEAANEVSRQLGLEESVAG